MQKTTLTILTSALLLVTMPLVTADETKADCESDTEHGAGPYGGGQGWIGYTSTDFFRYGYENMSQSHPVILDTCEGEHWDGQDSVNPEGTSGGSGTGCASIAETDPASGRVHVVNCMGGDPNEGAADATQANPVRLRLVAENSNGRSELYIATDIALVGRAVVYQGYCEGSEGLEGSADCTGSKEARTGAYVRDNTPLNVLATAVSAPGLTKGYVAENDCDQETYQLGAETNDRTKCGRDNTAITIGAVLP